MFQHPNHSGEKEKRKSKKWKTYLKNNEGELPHSGEKTRHASPWHSVQDTQGVPKKLDPRRNTKKDIS